MKVRRVNFRSTSDREELPNNHEYIGWVGGNFDYMWVIEEYYTIDQMNILNKRRSRQGTWERIRNEESVIYCTEQIANIRFNCRNQINH